jgi:transketolase
MIHEIDQGLLYLLRVKDSDIRIDTLIEGQTTHDRSFHIGGAFSAVIPAVSIFYSGVLNISVEHPTESGRDIFVLSKGHAVQSIASIYADKGYIEKELLNDSRSFGSYLNGHPGPLLRGFHVATGPLGQGLSAAVGFALSQKLDESGRTYCLCGDGEVQEGMIWEAARFAGVKKLNNLCVIVDRNHGQNDIVSDTVYPMSGLKDEFAAFGFEAVEVNGDDYKAVVSVLQDFNKGLFEKPLAIISDCKKGQGGFSSRTSGHKITTSDEFAELEIRLQHERREKREKLFIEYYNRQPDEKAEVLVKLADYMEYKILKSEGRAVCLNRIDRGVLTKRVPARDKELHYDESKLPKVIKGEDYECHKLISDVIAVLGQDSRLVAIDADQGLITGLCPGMAKTDENRAINVGISEANMMGISEAFAARGYNAWCGCFGVFLEWRVLRRIAVGYQERLENIKSKDGWLSEGHGLDITFIANSSNLDTQTNGATHMSTDDVNSLSEIPHLKVIDTSCPRQLLAVMKWIAGGNKGLVLLRTLRPKVKAIYEDDYIFEYGRGYSFGETQSADIVIVSSGRGVHEALSAAEILRTKYGRKVTVVDMPSIDRRMLKELNESDAKIVFAEQNNAWLFNTFLRAMYDEHSSVDVNKVLSLSTLEEDGSKRFLHSGTLPQFYDYLKLDGLHIAERVESKFGK